MTMQRIEDPAHELFERVYTIHQEPHEEQRDVLGDPGSLTGWRRADRHRPLRRPMEAELPTVWPSPLNDLGAYPVEYRIDAEQLAPRVADA